VTNPPEFKLVPVEPDAAMRAAARRANGEWDSLPEATRPSLYEHCWNAMLAASPSPPGDLLPCECGQMPRSSAKRSWCVNEACPRFGEDFLTVTWPKAASPSPPSEPDGEVVRLRAEVAILQNNLEAEEACRANISAHFDALNDECAALHAALATRPAAPDGLKLEKREFAGAADPGYDSHAYEYARGWNDCVDTVKHRAARLAPVALSSEERRCLLALEGSVTGHYYPAEVAVVCALVRRLTTNEPKGV
jgi:hypothetical protein